MERTVAYTQQRLCAALRQIDELEDQDFGYQDVELAIGRVRQIFEDHLEGLRRPFRRQDLRPEFCLDALEDLRVYLPLLGVFVRSATVRNAFEIYGPLRKLARGLLGKEKIRLILSSGWDYTPLTFRPIPRLEEFVILVLPAPESSNPLLIPLAGHELGHAVWEHYGLEQKLSPLVGGALTEYVEKNSSSLGINLSGRAQETAQAYLEREVPNFAVASGNLRRQLEEFFCDFVGLCLFGESYVHAFAYFLSPDFAGGASTKYPAVHVRLQQLQIASALFAAKWGDTMYRLPDLSGMFHQRGNHPRQHTPANPAPSRSPWQQAVVDVAIALVPQLLDEVVRISEEKNWGRLSAYSLDKRKAILANAFRWGVPASDSGGLVNLLIAGWDVERDRKFWSGLPSFKKIDPIRFDNYRRQVLGELLLKNIEVLEYEELMARNQDAAST